MPGQSKTILRKSNFFVKYPKQTYATIPDGLLKVLSKRKIGRNSWAVIVALCKAVYADGRLGIKSSKAMQELTGLNDLQIARGMAELKQVGIIESVLRTNAQGYRHLDRSVFNHVSQYRIKPEVWEKISQEPSSIEV